MCHISLVSPTLPLCCHLRQSANPWTRHLRQKEKGKAECRGEGEEGEGEEEEWQRQRQRQPQRPRQPKAHEVNTAQGTSSEHEVHSIGSMNASLLQISVCEGISSGETT
jgi:hypothetical protein